MKSKVYKPFFLLFGLVLIVSLACITTTPTAGPQQPPEQPPVEQPPVEQPPSPPEVQPTEAPTVAVASEKFFTEEFDGAFDNWKTFLTHGEERQLNLHVEDGRLVFDISGKNVWAYLTYTPQKYTDVRIDVNVDNRGTNNNNISLLCRYSEDEGWYEFNIANSGLYDILYGKWDTDKRKASYVRIADGGSTKIHQGKDVNDYTIICKGRTLSLYINGNETRVIDDNRFALRDGLIGISASSFTSPDVKVEYNWVKISEP